MDTGYHHHWHVAEYIEGYESDLEPSDGVPCFNIPNKLCVQQHDIAGDEYTDLVEHLLFIHFHLFEWVDVDDKKKHQEGQ